MRFVDPKSEVSAPMYYFEGSTSQIMFAFRGGQKNATFTT